MDASSRLQGGRLCHIDDCEKNDNGTCIVNAFFDDDICKNNRKINKSFVKKKYEMFFDKSDCIELAINTSSKGAQRKWISADKKYFIKECFYYQLRYWNDDLVEKIASIIAGQLNINHLEQHLGNISGVDCSYTDFWGDVKFIAFGKLKGSDNIWEYKDAIDRIKFSIDLMFQYSGIDCTGYLADMTLLDYIVGNEDRHLYNFGLLYDGIKYYIAPLFDCGLGLFEHDIDYIGRNLKDWSKKPFGSWHDALNYFDSVHGYSSLKNITVPYNLIPSKLAKEYLQLSLKNLGKELVLCD